MAYADLEDVENILPPEEDLPEDDRGERNLLTALEEATDLVEGYLDRRYTGTPDSDGVPEDVPDAVRRATARIALRVFLDEPSNPGAESEVDLMGPFSHTINWMKEAQARSAFLTDFDKMRLDPYKLFPATGVIHAPMAGSGGTCWWDG
jgi:hypothetical protein